MQEFQTGEKHQCFWVFSVDSTTPPRQIHFVHLPRHPSFPGGEFLGVMPVFLVYQVKDIVDYLIMHSAL